ncbi:C45 family peptidase [Rhizobium sp. CNPSo 4039]|uniref:C45 family autoproteolytic acyltransferase/hydolase n=1 Tax=Rhizobium sp. CNPSo 4039 TaxID=3021409 RepID=UPI00254B6ECD|nr:C45 family peptidase [Rhizobium sp. CNPSo 4039]MDK4717294.1 C45 family autoproteolytic acyltransferase/hydrolase [Rhizobium sp. CNPSo 4039]
MSIDTGYRLTTLSLKGNHYEIGQGLGRQGAVLVHDHLIKTYAWAAVMALKNSDRIQMARSLVEQRYPHYWQELSGLADGLGLPFDDVFAWNCRGDLWAMAPDGCTTVQIPGTFPVVAHNEDGDPGLRSGCTLATIIPEQGQPFTAFVYPGSIPGHTFAINGSGLVLTVNNIRSTLGGEGLPRMVLTRAILNCPTIDAALDLLSEAPRSGAFHLTLAQAGQSRLTSIEFTRANCSIVDIASPSVHANHLVHAQKVSEPQIITGSSRSRQERGQDMLDTNHGSLDPLSILWDRKSHALPIYRTQPDDPDNENTLATAIFKIGKDSVDWAVYDAAGSAARFENIGLKIATM